ncbi:MAG: hypothetical protein JWR77_1371 [Rhizorhabdus sp.]|nr:hypothetical protein [Rhizorhabdus sp.]
MDPEQDIEDGEHNPTNAIKRHAAGAGIGLVGLLLGFAIFGVSVVIGLYLWGVKHHFTYLLESVAIGYTINFALRRISLR